MAMEAPLPEESQSLSDPMGIYGFWKGDDTYWNGDGTNREGDVTERSGGSTYPKSGDTDWNGDGFGPWLHNGAVRSRGDTFGGADRTEADGKSGGNGETNGEGDGSAGWWNSDGRKSNWSNGDNIANDDTNDWWNNYRGNVQGTDKSSARSWEGHRTAARSAPSATAACPCHGAHDIFKGKYNATDPNMDKLSFDPNKILRMT